MFFNYYSDAVTQIQALRRATFANEWPVYVWPCVVKQCIKVDSILLTVASVTLIENSHYKAVTVPRLYIVWRKNFYKFSGPWSLYRHVRKSDQQFFSKIRYMHEGHQSILETNLL